MCCPLVYPFGAANGILSETKEVKKCVGAALKACDVGSPLQIQCSAMEGLQTICSWATWFTQ